MKIKPNSYYKRYYNNYYSDHYSIWYTGNKYAYIIARKYTNDPLVKLAKKEVWWTIEEWNKFINRSNYNKMEEISKGDVFLELL